MIAWVAQLARNSQGVNLSNPVSGPQRIKFCLAFAKLLLKKQGCFVLCRRSPWVGLCAVFVCVEPRQILTQILAGLLSSELEKGNCVDVGQVSLDSSPGSLLILPDNSAE